MVTSLQSLHADAMCGGFCAISNQPHSTVTGKGKCREQCMFMTVESIYGIQQLDRRNNLFAIVYPHLYSLHPCNHNFNL
jgi:hypothetical protein